MSSSAPSIDFNSRAPSRSLRIVSSQNTDTAEPPTIATKPNDLTSSMEELLAAVGRNETLLKQLTTQVTQVSGSLAQSSEYGVFVVQDFVRAIPQVARRGSISIDARTPTWSALMLGQPLAIRSTMNTVVPAEALAEKSRGVPLPIFLKAVSGLSAVGAIVSLYLWLGHDVVFVNPFISLLTLVTSPFIFLMGKAAEHSD